MFIVHVHCSLFMFIVHCSHGATLIFDDLFIINYTWSMSLVSPSKNFHFTRSKNSSALDLWVEPVCFLK